MDLNSSLKVSLQALAEPDYQKFSSNLLPGTSNILGVRLPLLRKIAKKLAKSDWATYLNQALDDSFEEIMLQGITIGYIRTELSVILPYVTRFVAKIDNWSVCDSFCSSLKLPKQHPNEMWNYITPYLTDSREYYVRFGVVMLIIYYIDEEHIGNVLKLLDGIKHSGYYARMSVAWAVSICYINFPEITRDYLTNNTLDDYTYNKALQKIVESLKIDSNTKKYIRSLKRR